MRVAAYYNNRDLRVEERPRPEVGPGELLLRVEASGICGSDIMEWYRLAKAPCVLGHEIAGRVEEAGEGVEAFRVGDRVVATHHVPCNTCRYCLRGSYSVCDTLRATDFDPGGFAEYVRLPAINVDRGTYRLPKGVSYEEASFVEPLACVIRAQRIAGLLPGDSVAVLGSGISGILHIQLARCLGASRIVATDLHAYRLDMALKFGATAAIDARDDVPERILEVNENRLADRVIVCTAAPPAIAQAFRSVDRGGSVMFFAPSPPGTTFPFPLHDMWKDGVTITHSYAGPPADLRVALDMIALRRLDVASMITHRLGLDRVAEGFRLMEEAGESLKIIIRPQR